MRSFLHTVHFNGVVVIGEGEKDEAPMLFNGEHVGDGTGPECDVAVDPIDGTRLTALGINNALSVLAVAERGSMFDPSAVFYMEKLVTGPEAADMVDLRLPVKQNLHLIAKAKGKKVNQLNVMILDRDRHRRLVEEIRDAGARTKFIMDGDVAGAIAAARDGTGVDALMGIGGTPEGIVTACAIKSLGGVIQGRLWPTSDDEKQKAIDAGHDLDRVLTTNDLVTSDNCYFAATGITDGDLLRGRPLLQGQGPDPVDRDALQVRHHPLRRRRAPGQTSGTATRASSSGPPQRNADGLSATKTPHRPRLVRGFAR